MPSTFRIEKLTDIELLRQCIDVQRQAWGFAEVDVVPLRMLVVCTRIGGQVLGARDSEGKVVGFLNALPGFRDGRVYLHSHMLGVLPGYQNLGVGRALKWAQREEALARGIRLIEWTFDPLEFRNARLNIQLLGSISRRYLVNIYGISSSPLHRGLPTDRLIAEWYLDSPRVRAFRLKEMRGAAVPCALKVELPLNFGELRKNDPPAALQVQLEFRERMLRLLQENYCVVGFEVNSTSQRAQYYLQSQVPDIPEI
ncbi:MAG TPA: GNAT family N-acetyltransferase [Terriglobia bacterium]|nr:GNAT family N-acetyltransferase [Terriglobia bacterium]